MALSVGDLQGSVALLNSAFEIHQSHDDIVSLRTSIVERFERGYKNMDTSDEADFYKAQLDALKAYPVFETLEFNLED